MDFITTPKEPNEKGPGLEQVTFLYKLVQADKVLRTGSYGYNCARIAGISEVCACLY